jgi:acetate kinase
MKNHHRILVINPGSTSLKYKLIEFPSETILSSGKIERIGSTQSTYDVKIGKVQSTGSLQNLDYPLGVEWLLNLLTGKAIPQGQVLLKDITELSAVGFKAVHGGKFNTHRDAIFLTEEVISEMERMLPTALVHNKAYLQAIRCFAEVAPDIPRVALFEPAFHATISEEKITYGIPHHWKENLGIRRYGFHGASHRYIATRTHVLLGWSEQVKKEKRLVSCHLGGSSSLCAIRNGESVDTTMGFSPQSGIIHSTRCETIDPFAVLFAQTCLDISPEEVGKILCDDSGLKGVSGVSGDMRDLWDAAKKDSARAKLALDIFFYQVRREIAAMVSSLAGLDVLVFTGGIGENGVRERIEICHGLEYLGILLDKDRNENAQNIEAKISKDGTNVEVWAIPTNEELIVGREVYKLIQ